MNARRLIGIGLILISILLAITFPLPKADPDLGRPITDFWFLAPGLAGLIFLIWPNKKP
ncbi:hypothetical protein X778_30290 [Pseudomonas aeruginosa VRFPA07]|nr:hypothetical protein X778_30290 [Pseudomonas aeruginosa VRFPA07]